MVYESIKNALLKVLNSGFPDYHLFADDIKKLNDAIKNQHIENYIFISLIPVVNTRSGKFIDRTMLISIMLRNQDETITNYMRDAEQLDELLQVLHFDDRYITIHETRAVVVDWKLQYTFNLAFRDSSEDVEPDMPMIGELVINEKGW